MFNFRVSRCFFHKVFAKSSTVPLCFDPSSGGGGGSRPPPSSSEPHAAWNGANGKNHSSKHLMKPFNLLDAVKRRSSGFALTQKAELLVSSRCGGRSRTGLFVFRNRVFCKDTWNILKTVVWESNHLLKPQCTEVDLWFCSCLLALEGSVLLESFLWTGAELGFFLELNRSASISSMFWNEQKKKNDVIRLMSYLIFQPIREQHLLDSPSCCPAERQDRLQTRQSPETQIQTDVIKTL